MGTGLTPVELTWTAIPSAFEAGPGETKVELAREGADPFWVPVAPLSGKAMTWLEPGAYRWRIVGLLGATGREKPFASPWREFSAVPLAAPLVRGPMAGARIYAAGAAAKSAPVALSWNPPAQGLLTEVEITPSSAPAPLEGNRGGLMVDLAPGNYMWRARARVRGRDEVSEWSDQRGFEVVGGPRPLKPVAEVTGALAPEHAAAPPAAGEAPAAPASPARPPVALAPAAPAAPAAPSLQVRQVALGSPPERAADAWIEEGAVEVGTRARGAGLADGLPIQLEWKPIEGVRQYQVTLSDPDGTVISKDMATQPSFRFNLDRLRDVNYSVAARLPSGGLVRSAPAPIRIILSPPEPVKPARGAQVSQRASVVLSWEKTFFAERYRVQVVRSNRLSEAVIDRTIPGNFTSFQPDGPGRYLWRVKAVSAKGESPWSAARSFVAR